MLYSLSQQQVSGTYGTVRNRLHWGRTGYEILGYPTTFYLDHAGMIQFKRAGFEESGYEEGVARRIDALRAEVDASATP